MRKLRDAAPYLIAAAVLLVQSGKAFHIDDGTFLALARDARKDPLHPYLPGAQSNPPGAPWLLGAITALFGDSERALHLALLPLTLLSIYAVGAAARRLGARDGHAAALLFACSGVVLLPASTLMPDVPMVGAVAGAVALLWSDADEPRWWKIAGASALFAIGWTLRISAAPVLVLAALVQLSKRRWRALVPLAVLGGAFVAWSWASRVQTGAAQTVATAQLHGSGSASFVIWRGLSTVAALALFSAGPLAATVLRPSRRLVEALALLLFAAAPLGWFPALLVGIGTVAFVLARLRLPARDRDTAFLWLWFFGALAVPLVYNQAAAKFVALALPPLLFLVLRGIQPRPLAVWACAAASLVVSVAVGTADERYANALRGLTFSQVAKARVEAPRVFVAGTPWGAEEYAPRAGAVFLWGDLTPGSPAAATVAAGDQVLDLSHPGSLGIPPQSAALVAQGVLEDPLPLRTMSDGAGLWSSHVGLLPWVLSAGSLQPWWRIRILQPIR
jgi:hypothetical protein